MSNTSHLPLLHSGWSLTTLMLQSGLHTACRSWAKMIFIRWGRLCNFVHPLSLFVSIIYLMFSSIFQSCIFSTLPYDWVIFKLRTGQHNVSAYQRGVLFFTTCQKGVENEHLFPGTLGSWNVKVLSASDRHTRRVLSYTLGRIWQQVSVSSHHLRPHSVNVMTGVIADGSIIYPQDPFRHGSY